MKKIKDADIKNAAQIKTIGNKNPVYSDNAPIHSGPDKKPILADSA